MAYGDKPQTPLFTPGAEPQRVEFVSTPFYGKASTLKDKRGRPYWRVDVLVEGEPHGWLIYSGDDMQALDDAGRPGKGEVRLISKDGKDAPLMVERERQAHATTAASVPSVPAPQHPTVTSGMSWDQAGDLYALVYHGLAHRGLPPAAAQAGASTLFIQHSKVPFTGRPASVAEAEALREQAQEGEGDATPF